MVKIALFAEIMTGYLKIGMGEKTIEIYKSLKEEILKNNLNDSYAVVLLDFIYVQSLTD